MLKTTYYFGIAYVVCCMSTFMVNKVDHYTEEYFGRRLGRQPERDEGQKWE